jgi:predicted membrane channel-forming protein YqfA (hemolysin III family)
MVSVLATACTFMTLQTGFRSPNFRALRSAMYAGLGLSFIIPILHSISIYGTQVQIRRMSLDWMLLMATFNLAGAATYAARVSRPALSSLDCRVSLIFSRFRRNYFQDDTIYMEPAIKFCTLQLSSLGWRICLDSSEHLTIYIQPEDYVYLRNIVISNHQIYASKEETLNTVVTNIM